MAFVSFITDNSSKPDQCKAWSIVSMVGIVIIIGLAWDWFNLAQLNARTIISLNLDMLSTYNHIHPEIHCLPERCSIDRSIVVCDIHQLKLLGSIHRNPGRDRFGPSLTVYHGAANLLELWPVLGMLKVADVQCDQVISRDTLACVGEKWCVCKYSATSKHWIQVAKWLWTEKTFLDYQVCLQ